MWEVPYLPIDPKHVGRTYESVVRVNSQSGKGGVAYVMKEEHGFDLPRRLQIEFSKNIQGVTEARAPRSPPAEMWTQFEDDLPLGRHHPAADLRAPHQRRRGRRSPPSSTRPTVPAPSSGTGNGPVSAFVHGLAAELGIELDVLDYSEHAIGAGADTQAVAYVETQSADGDVRWGVGVHDSIVAASLRAVLSAMGH